MEPGLDITYRDALIALGRSAGLGAVGVCSAEPLSETRSVIEERKAAGLHGGMQFTYRNPERSTTPGRILRGARSLIVGAWDYPPPTSGGADPVDQRVDEGRPTARVAAYAVGDHYVKLKAALQRVADRLSDDGHRAVVVADDNALVDRAVAARAGIGWFGKNSNILRRGQGSWFVLGAVVTDADLAPTPVETTDCGACRRCMTGCPTDAIVAPGVVDGSRCLAWLLQRTGDFPPEYREALGDRLYGCDDCQEVCPIGDQLPTAEHEPATDGVDVFGLLAADDDTLMATHGRWYIPERNPDYLRRNALVVLGNSGAARTPELVATLERSLHHENDMIVRHAAWAARRLGCDDLVVSAGADRP